MNKSKLQFAIASFVKNKKANIAYYNDGIALPDGYPSLRNDKCLFYRYKNHTKEFIDNELGINEYRCVKMAATSLFMSVLNVGRNSLSIMQKKKDFIALHVMLILLPTIIIFAIIAEA